MKIAEQNDLPDGWAWASIGEVTETTVEQKALDKSGSGKFLYVDIGSIDNKEKRILNPKILPLKEAPSRAKQQLEPSDILVSLTRPNLNAVAKLPENMAGAIGSTGLCVLRTNWISSGWIYYAVQTSDFVSAMSNQVKGALYPAIRPKDVIAYKIPIPPLAEQYRIVDEIETRFNRLEIVVQALKRIHANLERLRFSIFKAASEGRLVQTEAERARIAKSDYESAEELLARLLPERRRQWEEYQSKKIEGQSSKSKTRYSEPVAPNLVNLPELPEGWVWASPEQLSTGADHSLAIGPFGSNLKVTDYREHGVPLVFVRNIRSGIFDGPESPHISLEKAEELFAHTVRSGDILITKMGEPPGDARLYPIGRPPAVITADCLKWTLSPLLGESRYFVDVFNSEIMRGQIKEITSGVAQQKISLTRFKSIAIPVPPFEEQKRIVAETQRRFSILEKIQSVVEINLKRAETLQRTILQRAFTGRLVPQDSDDESAERLLERIRVQKIEKQNAEIKEKRRPKSKTADSQPVGKKSQGLLPFEPSNGASKTTVAVASSDSGAKVQDMKLLKLKLDDDYKSLHEFNHVFRSAEMMREDLSPICLVGINGSGKSNLIESLSEIFCYLELINLPYQSIKTKHKQTNLRFEIEYLMPTATEATGNASNQRRHIKIIKRDSSSPIFLERINGIDKEITERTAQLAALPTRIIGYSSGLNETINIPYFKTKTLYSRDVYERARKKSVKPVEDSRTLFMDYDSNATILLANYIFDPDESFKLFNKHTRIASIASFEIVVQLKRPGKEPVELTRELKNSITKLKHCARETKYDKKRDISTFIYEMDPESLTIFRETFADAKDFFKTIHRLSLLNALALGKREREFYLREGLKEGLLEPAPTVSSEDKIFSINRLGLMLSDPPKKIDYAGISDGEHQFIHVLGTVKLFDEPGVLFLLDEPETHFNPRWRREFVQLLEEIPSTHSQEFVISTHSPFIVSGCRKENVFKFRRQAGFAICKPVDFETYGASFEFLLTQLFDMDALISESALEDLRHVMKSDNLQELESAINQFGESFEKRFLFEKIAKLKKAKQ